MFFFIILTNGNSFFYSYMQSILTLRRCGAETDSIHHMQWSRIRLAGQKCPISPQYWNQKGLWGGTSIASFCYKNTSLLIHKSLRSAFVLKTYALLIAIRTSVDDIKPGGPLGAFRKQQAYIGAGFPFHPSPLHIHHSYITSQYNIHILSSWRPSYTYSLSEVSRN